MPWQAHYLGHKFYVGWTSIRCCAPPNNSLGFDFFPIHALLASAFFLSYFLRLGPPSSEKGLILVSLYKDILGLKGLQIFIESRKVLGPLWSIFLFSGCFAKSTFQPYSFFLVFQSFLTQVYPSWTYFTMTNFLILFPTHRVVGHLWVLSIIPIFIGFYAADHVLLNSLRAHVWTLLTFFSLGLWAWSIDSSFTLSIFLGASWASPFIWLLGFSY